MSPSELKSVTEAVGRAGELIQPHLLPHPGLAQRNSYAHIWLGIKTLFGNDWRQRAPVASVLAFVDWIVQNPNTDYEVYPGPVDLLPEGGQPSLFGD